MPIRVNLTSTPVTDGGLTMGSRESGVGSRESGNVELLTLTMGSREWGVVCRGMWNY